MRTESSPARTDGHHGQPRARSPLPGGTTGTGKRRSSGTRPRQPRCSGSRDQSPALAGRSTASPRPPTAAQVSTVPSGGSSVPPAPRAGLERGGCCLPGSPDLGFAWLKAHNHKSPLSPWPLSPERADLVPPGLPVPTSVTSQRCTGGSSFGTH